MFDDSKKEKLKTILDDYYADLYKERSQAL